MVITIDASDRNNQNRMGESKSRNQRNGISPPEMSGHCCTVERDSRWNHTLGHDNHNPICNPIQGVSTTQAISFISGSTIHLQRLPHDLGVAYRGSSLVCYRVMYL